MLGLLRYFLAVIICKISQTQHCLVSNWLGKTCVGLSSAIVIGFYTFFAYSIAEGISKQSVYVGAVGFWLGAYFLFALIASAICVTLLLWMYLKHESRWRRHAVLLLCAWGVVLLSYWAWHLFAQTQYRFAL